MSLSDESITCPSDYSEALDFDPELAAIMERDSLTRIRLPYGDAGARLVTDFRPVQQVCSDQRFSRARSGHRALTPHPARSRDTSAGAERTPLTATEPQTGHLRGRRADCFSG